ncbi:MAG TPA: acetyl-CoA carboxylase, carboxyltransferase subunit beta [Bacilli bacterium]|nr:acetyl-CoA carboxylase, carboxyltransferase subunit beta [Bacilli bacterium]
MNNFFDKRKVELDVFKQTVRNRKIIATKINIPDGLFMKCEICNEMVLQEDVEKNLEVCPNCNNHFRISARLRLKMMCDGEKFTELFTTIQTVNPLKFPDYLEKIQKYQTETKELDAFVAARGAIDGIEVAIGALDSYFMMGSMGSAVGEKVTRLIEYATKHRLPLIIFSASGGARMQEGIFSLMQMAKTAAALKYHSGARLLYISVLTNPTTGGVAASFASLGDINIAESGALIGFAGQRVIKQTINQELPKDFQTAEFQLAKGFVDLILSRKDLKPTISKLLQFHCKGVK